MARDIRTKQNDYFDRNKYYKHKIVDNVVVRDEVCAGVFYSKDVVALSSNKNGLGNDTQYVVNQVVITTRDVVSDLEINDFVLYGGELYRVDNIIADDTNKAKQFSNRPDFNTQITLVKICNQTN